MRYICFVGAGASIPFGVPSMTQMAEQLEGSLQDSYGPHVDLYRNIKRKLQDYQWFDIEALITVLQDIINTQNVRERVFNNPAVHYFAEWGFSFERMISLSLERSAREKEAAQRLLLEVKSFVAEACRIKSPTYETYDAFFQEVMHKDGRRFEPLPRRRELYRIPCVIFTTNYDQVLEAYCRSRNLDYATGELSNQALDISARNSELYPQEPHRFLIYKLHGSVNWYMDQNNDMRWLTEPAQPGSTTLLGDTVSRELLIYPVREKYTFREPFYSMFHHFKNRLVSADYCYVVGYSFRDDDILGLFLDALGMNDQLRILIVDPNAASIKAQKYSDFQDRVHTVDMEFSVQAARNVGSVVQSA